MELWEALLWVLLIIAGGTGLLILLSRLVFLFDREPQTISVNDSTLPFTSGNPEVPLVVEEQLKLQDLELMTEVDDNLRIASESWTGELIPFHTSVWDAEQYEVYELPTKLRNDLKHVYDIIDLANQIVWLSAEFNRRSHDADETYKRMRTSIAETLHRIKQNVK